MGWGRGAGREAVGREDKGGKGLLGDELQMGEGRQGNLLRVIRWAYENLVARVGACGGKGRATLCASLASNTNTQPKDTK